MDSIHVLHNLVSGQVHAAGLGPRGYSAVERLHKSGLTAADMWCLDAERRNMDDPQGIRFRRLQVTHFMLHSVSPARRVLTFVLRCSSQAAE